VQRAVSAVALRSSQHDIRICRLGFIPVMTKFVLSIATLGLLLNASAAQVAVSSTAEPKVTVAFFASDDHDKPLSEISQSELQILDNKKPPKQMLEMKRRTDVPLLLGVVIDISGSQHDDDQYKAAVQGASEFTKAVLSGANDMAFFEQFSAVPEATPIMAKSEFLTLKVDLRPAGRTALYDAVRFACDERMKSDSLRNYLRVIVLLSDGEDNSSRNDIRQAIASAQRAGVVIFAVDTATIFHSGFFVHAKGTEMLQQLARETGGFAFLDLDQGGLTKAFTTLKEQIDSMYLLSYVPADPAGPSYHSLKIDSIPRKPRVKVRATHGYYSHLIVP